MWPWLLGSAAVGGVLGGVRGYQQSGGDLGQTLAGAASGGLLGGATAGLGSLAGGAAQRYAGQAFGLQGALGKTLASKAAAGTLTGPEAILLKAPGIAGGAANIGTQLAAGSLLAPAAGAMGQLTAQGAGLVGGATQAMKPAPGMPNVSALPPGYQEKNRPTKLYDVLYGPGLTARTAEELEQDIQMKGLQKQYSTMYPMLSQAKKDEMQRGLAAAQIRQNIATAANMVERAQATPQTIGINAANQLGNALSATYNYG